MIKLNMIKDLRKKANNDFDNDFYKLINNEIF